MASTQGVIQPIHIIMPAYTSQSSSDGELPLDIEKQCTSGKGGHDRPTGEKENELSNSERDDDDRWVVEPEPDFLDTNAAGAAGALGRVLSRISTKASLNPGPPPDGGKRAWLMCK